MQLLEHSDAAVGGSRPEHVDVLILGAGISGIGAACQLTRRLPHKSVVILEARERLGGTWDLFRYPGIRSDSDMFTMGYRLRSWQDPRGIADGASILGYVRETAREFDVERLIRFRQRALAASWSSERAAWTVTIEDLACGERHEMSCSFLFACTGYYRYEQGYTPRFAGAEDFHGPIIHPQHWPQELDYRDRRILVIGSGATAVTLVPSLVAGGARHVTMLQRSPSYIVPVPARDRLAARLERLLPPRTASWLVRWRNVLRMIVVYQLCRRAPRLMRAVFKHAARSALPPGYDVDTHFTPSYNPWDQRVCMAADGDFFAAIRHGSADVVTARLERFTGEGVRLEDGREIAADIIVTATGLTLQMLGGMQLTVDGQPVEPSEHIAYKGMMLCGVPNFAMTLGYTNASWTLKADLVAEHVARLLAHMERLKAASCTPRPPRGQAGRPILDLSSGYILRSLQTLPKQGERPPWRLHQNYISDVWMLRRGPVDDEMDFSPARAGAREVELAAA